MKLGFGVKDLSTLIPIMSLVIEKDNMCMTMPCCFGLEFIQLMGDDHCSAHDLVGAMGRT